MALTELTKVTGPGIHTLSNVLSHNIKSSGIITATKFSGPLDSIGGNFAGVITATNGVFSGNISAVDGNFSGNVTIGGTLTYEDVTNIDSVGIITARDGLKVLAGGANVVGVVTATTFKGDGDFVDIDVDGHTNLDNVSIAGVTTFATGTVFTGAIDANGDLDVDGHTNLDNVSIAGVTTVAGDIIGSQSQTFIGADTSDGSDNKSMMLGGGGSSSVSRGAYVWVKGNECSGSGGELILAGGGVSSSLIDFYTNSGQRARITSTGELNIGGSYTQTTNKLNVTGTAYVSSDITAGDDIIATDEIRNNVPSDFWASDNTFISFNSYGNLTHMGGYETNLTSNGYRDTNGQWKSLAANSNTGAAQIGLSPQGNIIFRTDASKSNGTAHNPTERLRITSIGDLLLGNHGSRIFDDSSGTNVVVDIYGGTTAGKRGILALGGRSGSDDADLGTIQFLNENNNLATAANHVQSKLVASIDVKSETSDSNSGSDSGGHLLFSTKPETGAITERLRIKSDGKVLITNTLGLGGATSNPSELLHAQTASGEAKIVVMGATTGTVAISGLNGASRVLFGDSSTENAGNITYTHSSDSLSFRVNGNTRWKFDSSGHFLPDSVGSYNIGSATAEIGDIYFANSKGLKLGSSQVGDLYNDGTDTYFRNSVSNGQTLIRSGGNIWISDYAGNHRAAFRDNSSVDLYFDIENNATAKLSTTVKGISVHGEVAASQDYPNFRPTLDFNFAAEKKLDPRITYQRTGVASFVNEFGKVVLVGDNVPRFDHDPVTRESKGLLIEESRTNFMKYSDEFAIDNGQTGGNWDAIGGESNYTRVSDTTETKDPTGITNHASKLTFTGSSATLRGYWYSGAADGAVSKTFSVYLKRATSNTTSVKLDIGDQGTTTYTITDEWKRYSVTTSSAGNGNFVDMHVTSGANTAYYAWGAQIEAGSFATSYIPTSSAAVTRGNESFEIDGEDFTDFFNATEGTVLSHITPLNGSLGNHSGTGGVVWSFDAGGSFGNGNYFSNSNSTTAFGHSVVVGSSGQNTGGGTGNMTNGVPFKNATVFKKDDFIMATNGTLASADTSGNLPTVVKLVLGNNGWGNFLNGANIHFNRFAYYPKRLPNTQLVTLTS